MPDTETFPYVYINADGTARELHPDERAYLETEFRPGDGAAPAIKRSYEDRNGWGEISGFLARSRLPEGTLIREAPADNPSRALNKAEYIAWLQGKGMTVTEKNDGSLVISKPRREETSS
jgi:hypothetical protein